jgi:nicotinamide-nucleotide amidase
VEIGYLPQMSENWVTLFVAASSEEDARRRIKEVEDMVIARLGSQHIIGHNDECLEMVIGCLLRERKWRLAVAESCTGGLLASRITAVAGASDYFDRGFITYSNRAKVELLKVPEELLREHGAVSEPVAGAMAQGAREEAGAEAALAVTGIAGPTGGTAQKPVGTVFIACATLDGVVVEEHRFQGARSHIQENAAQAALVLLWRVLSGDPHIYCH